MTIVLEGKMFMDMMDNMRYYNAGREVPDAAKKTIKGGTLSGFTISTRCGVSRN